MFCPARRAQRDDPRAHHVVATGRRPCPRPRDGRRVSLPLRPLPQPPTQSTEPAPTAADAGASRPPPPANLPARGRRRAWADPADGGRGQGAQPARGHGHGAPRHSAGEGAAPATGPRLCSWEGTHRGRRPASTAEPGHGTPSGRPRATCRKRAPSPLPSTPPCSPASSRPAWRPPRLSLPVQRSDRAFERSCVRISAQDAAVLTTGEETPDGGCVSPASRARRARCSA